MSKKTQQPRQSIRSAFTLIEILVVVSILVIMTALLVPRLRMVTKERNIREAARVVGSMFTQASQRAVTDGVSGVVLQRNDNFTAGGYLYAATRLGILREVPDFTGDQVGSVATAVSPGLVSIPYPLEQQELEIVKAGDSIRFGISSVSYQIIKVNELPSATPPVLNLVLAGAEGANYLPDPGVFTGGTPAGTRSYSIERLPRLLKSSVIDMPDGHIIDLRFSGCQTLDSGYQFAVDTLRGGLTPQFPINVIEPNPRKIEVDAANTIVEFGETTVEMFRPSDVVLLFDEQGKFDQIVFRQSYTTTGGTIATSAFLRTPQSPFFAFVAPSELDATVNPLVDENSLWVSVSNTSGVSNIGYNNPSGKAGFVPQDFTLANMQTLFQSDVLADRQQFNNIISAARAVSSTGSAAQ
jgi:prepilin-type N-terminal cleavage/methylation domain-containing protein